MPSLGTSAAQYFTVFNPEAVFTMLFRNFYGDFFTQADYDQVRRVDDNVFSRYAAKAKQDKTYEEEPPVEFDLYTETLAQIYAEQGYYEQAKDIYSKLILAYPEKSAYFAALIQKLNELNQYLYNYERIIHSFDSARAFGQRSHHSHRVASEW